MKSPSRVLLLVTLLGSSARADVKLPAIFSDHAVLQRDPRVPVWGVAEPGEKVTVKYAGQTQSATAGTDGKWQVALTNLKIGAPRTLTIEGKNTIAIQDVIVGEVWLGSGQSNMAMTVARARDFEAEQATAKFPLIRHFKEESGPNGTAQTGGK
ncbi:MAG: sialate O-acetylesterase, partial [Opitutus sp.]|nr:sialate O-acetylesterase [Opitutus sp.]